MYRHFIAGSITAILLALFLVALPHVQKAVEHDALAAIFAYGGWGVFLLALAWIVVFRNTVWKARLSMFSYLIIVLFDEVVWEEQSRRFKDWVAAAVSATDEQLFMVSIVATQEVADRLAKGSGDDSSIKFAMQNILGARKARPFVPPSAPPPVVVPTGVVNPSFVPPSADWFNSGTDPQRSTDTPVAPPDREGADRER